MLGRLTFCSALFLVVALRGAELTIENDELALRIDSVAGALSVTDKKAAYTYRQKPQAGAPGAPRFRNLARDGARATFEADFGKTGDAPNTVLVAIALDGRAITIEADVADRARPIARFAFLDPLILDTEAAVLAVADYSDGHLYPLDEKPFPKTWLNADRLDMPWVGICDRVKGFGYALILETSDDAVVQLVPCPGAGREVSAPRILWKPSKGAFGAPRKLVYRFVDKGSYVALAKAYRRDAAAQGLLVTLREKAAKNPNLARLFGAPDVWGDATLAFAKAAKAAGVEKMLIHGRSSAEDMRAINALGFLTSEYDNYTDIVPIEAGKGIDSGHDTLPDAAVLKADGQRMTAWLTWDKKTQFMKRCPALWVRAARAVIPNVLERFPYLGRFINVTTAEALYECHDANHPLTNAEKRRCGGDLLSYVRSLGVVVGGEHGIWWGVPHLDYIEGMMSGGFYSWPAGHLIHPKAKTEKFTSPWGGEVGEWSAYERWGIGHRSRAPLWELVFHDCIVSTWYWGDASDWLLAAAPEISGKKDAFNILYGTIPLLWANREGSWHAKRSAFLRSYRVTGPLNEAIACEEMVSHEFVTPEGDVQKTTFSGGTEIVVNFGADPYTLARGGGTLVLPQNGFAVAGPKIEQRCAIEDGAPVTTIRCEGFFFIDRGGVEFSARAQGPAKLRVQVGPCAKPVRFEPARCLKGWDSATARVYVLDAQGERKAAAPCEREGDAALMLGPFPDGALLEAVCGEDAALADCATEGITIEPGRVAQGKEVTATVAVRNVGTRQLDGVEIGFFADAWTDARLLAAQRLSLAPGEKKTVSQRIDTARLDGERSVLAVADPRGRVAELCERNNAAIGTLTVVPAFERWQLRREVRLTPGTIPWRGLAVRFEYPGNVDPASVRGLTSPAQGGQDGGVFLLAGPGPAPEQLAWCYNPKDRASAIFAPAGRLWRSEDATIDAETYRVRFENGVLVDLAAKRDGKAGAPFISKLIFSSKETGWIDEPGTVKRFEVIDSGPVRTTIVVEKVLHGGSSYRKTCEFYPRFFEVAFEMDGPASGVSSRAYYLRPGDFAGETGARAKVDGEGDGEGVIGRSTRWYAVHAPEWAHSCTSIDGPRSLTYWDSSEWGGIGFAARGGRDGSVRLRYVIRPGAEDPSFAEDDAREVTVGIARPSRAEILGGDGGAARVAPRLNFVIILVDDMGWRDLGCQGSTYYRTPHIDRLAAQGMRFTNGYAACAVCSPTRAALQTGRYPARLGVTDWIRAQFQGNVEPAAGARPPAYEGGPAQPLLCPRNAMHLDLDEVTIAEALKPAGFASCHVGKWHLGQTAHFPERQGYDVNRGGCDIGQPPTYFDPYRSERPSYEIPSLPSRRPGEYLTDREAAEAVGFIEANKDRPFVLVLCHYAVHTPLQAKQEVTARYEAAAGPRQGKPVYAAMVESVDDAAGAVMRALDAAGIADRTVVIFTSDNGGLLGSTDNSPLRSGKGFPYEGGIRVPWIVRWPGTIEPGTTCDVPISSIDLFPTILDLAGVGLPQDRPVDGVSLAPLFRGGTKLDRDALYWHFPHYRGDDGPYSIIRKGPWKVIRRYDPDGRELYNLADDFRETKDLAGAMPDKVRELDAQLAAWLASTGARMPMANPDYRR